MTPQTVALVEIARYLEEMRIPYATIGGLAVARWGQPRATQDADVTVLVPPDEEAEFLAALLRRFRGRLPDALEFAEKSRVVLLSASNGVPIDLALGLPGYQEEMLSRAVDVELEPGARVRFSTAEDLIIHKAVAGRPRDAQDIASILARSGEALDASYVRRWLAEFGAALGDFAASDLFESILRDARPGSPPPPPNRP